MSDVIGRLVADQDIVRSVARAATSRPCADLVGCVQVDPVPVVSMATDALACVSGRLAEGDDTAAWSVVLKVVHAPDRSPIGAQIPAEFHEAALAVIPWRTEPDLWRRVPLVP